MDIPEESEQNFLNNQSYKLLSENMLNGLAYCKMLFDQQGEPVDFIYLRVNPAFEELTGLKDVVGKPVSEVIPDIKTSNPELFAIYGRVASTGKPEQFDITVKQLAIDLHIRVYSENQGYFVAIFENTTEKKKIQDELKQKTGEVEQLNSMTVGRELKMVELKKSNKELEEKLNVVDAKTE